MQLAGVGLVALTVPLLVVSFHLAYRVNAKNLEHSTIVESSSGRVARRAALAARADEQRRWVMADDDRGVYGQYPPARL